MTARIALLIAALAQAAAPVVTFLGPGASPAQGGTDLLISPAGWAFAIWGPVYALAIAQAGATLLARADLPSRLVVDLLALYLAAVAWITAAALGGSLVTAVVLLVMAVAAIDAVATSARAPVTPAWLGRLTRVGVGLYAGWVTAALFVNLATATVATGAAGAREPGWQLVVLLLAAATVLAVVRGTANPAYAAAATWAFVAIAATTATASATVLLVVALLAALAVVAAAVSATRRRTAPA